MAELSREELKSRFRNGALAREENFADLIDSSVNKVNDNVRIEPETGLTLKTTNKKYLSFLNNDLNGQNSTPTFSFEAFDSKPNSKGLALVVPDKENVTKNLISFLSETNASGNVSGRVGINTTSPVTDFDVNGNIGMKGRIGTFYDVSVNPRQIIADGQWHKVVTNLKGLTALEIVTLAYCPDGKYAMYYSVLTNAFGKRNKIKPLHQCYSSWWHRIQIRWTKASGGLYGLEVRTVCSYKTKPVITTRITKLWN